MYIFSDAHVSSLYEYAEDSVSEGFSIRLQKAQLNGLKHLRCSAENNVLTRKILQLDSLPDVVVEWLSKMLFWYCDAY